MSSIDSTLGTVDFVFSSPVKGTFLNSLTKVDPGTYLVDIASTQETEWLVDSSGSYNRGAMSLLGITTEYDLIIEIQGT